MVPPVLVGLCFGILLTVICHCLEYYYCRRQRDDQQNQDARDVEQGQPRINQTLRNQDDLLGEAITYPQSGVTKKECPICLCEYEVGEECRVLPNCKHVYHRACIDAWFGVKAHCPLCRDSVLDANGV